MLRSWLTVPVLLVGCKGSFDLSTATVEDIQNLCAERTPELHTAQIVFEADPPGCAWGEDGNLEPAQGQVTARAEQRVSVDLPDDVVICDLTFDFEADSGSDHNLYYDDNMFILYNDVVLAASYGPMVDLFETSDGLPIYNWESLAGYEFSFSSTPTYCLGEAEGRADCQIPAPETGDPVSLSFEDDLIAELSVRAIQQGRYEYGFVTIGDNDPADDCFHEEFSFEVEVPYVVP
ncbi:MAG: hypothetical protein ACI9MC_001624 [Kiritimatiellia bacterium]|jgi:hypothetical protein